MLSDDAIKSKQFTKRALIMGIGKLSLMSMLAGRIYYLQVIKSEEFTTLSENNRIRIFLSPAMRSNILDRHGELLATNKKYYRILFYKEESNDVNKTLERFFAILHPSQQMQKEIIKKVSQNKKGIQSPILIASELDWQDVERIEVNAYDLPGIYVDVGQNRHYPWGEICAHIIGYVGPPTPGKENSNSLLKHPDIRVGKNGVEKSFNLTLSGSPGFKKKEVNAYGLTVRELSNEPSTMGENINLSIDIRLQNFLAQRLNEKGSAAVLLDILTGEILAMHSTPSFDPNKFAQGMSNEYWKDLTSNKSFPLMNKNIAMQFPPGSVYKLMVALAALEEGISPDLVVHCPGYMVMGNRKFNCWKEGGHGDMHGIVNAIAHSCNTYFFTLARALGVDKFANMANKFGLGNKTGIEIPGELAGVVPSKKWKKNKYHKEWQIGDTLNSAIGQGYVLTTPIQLAVMAARIASLGKKIIPTILSKSPNNLVNHPKFEQLDIKRKNLLIIQKAMDTVVNSPFGTAYHKRILDPNMKMAGKSGTSQVISKKGTEDLSKDNVSWINKNHGLFIAYAPIHNPRYACSVIVEHGGSGTIVAPIARDILTEVQKINS